MTDYYSILGLNEKASHLEIKKAFRRLAKIYHPDKNPNDLNAKISFENILKAYNILINPITKQRYDDGLLYSKSTTVNPRQTKTTRTYKEKSFTEEELQQKQYYYKQYQAKSRANAEQTSTKKYSDYKYILFAAPLSVGLLMLILSLFNKESEFSSKNKAFNNSQEISFAQLNNGDQPYLNYFKNNTSINDSCHLKVTNRSNYDAVVSVFDYRTKKHLQHQYVQNSHEIDFSQLPKTGIYWKCMIGKSWNPNKNLFNNKVLGGFDSLVQFQNQEMQPVLFDSIVTEQINILLLITPTSKNKRYISNDIEFFEK